MISGDHPDIGVQGKIRTYVHFSAKTFVKRSWDSSTLLVHKRFTMRSRHDCLTTLTSPALLSSSVNLGGEGWIRTSEASQDTCAPNPSPTSLPVSRIPSVLAGLMKHGVTVRVFGHFTTYPILNFIGRSSNSVYHSSAHIASTTK